MPRTRSDPIRRIVLGPPTSGPRSTSEPKRRNIVHIRALRADAGGQRPGPGRRPWHAGAKEQKCSAPRGRPRTTSIIDAWQGASPRQQKSPVRGHRLLPRVASSEHGGGMPADPTARSARPPPPPFGARKRPEDESPKRLSSGGDVRATRALPGIPPGGMSPHFGSEGAYGPTSAGVCCMGLGGLVNFGGHAHWCHARQGRIAPAC